MKKNTNTTKRKNTEEKKENIHSEKRTVKNSEKRNQENNQTIEELKKKAIEFLKSQYITLPGEKTNVSKSTRSQDIVPLEKSLGKVLKLKDGRYISIVEISPINFSSKSDESKVAVIQAYASWLKIAPKKLQFFVTTERTDATGLVETLEKKNKNEENVLVKERRQEEIEHVKMMSNQNALSKHFYIIYEYEGDDDSKVISKNEEDIFRSMMKTRMRIEAFLSQCGNSIVEHDNEDLFASELLYKQLNPRTSKTESFQDRIKRICTDHMLLNPQNFDFDSIPEDNFLAPKGNDLMHSDFLIRDGMYESYLYVKGTSFPDKVYHGWFDRFTKYGENVTVSFFCERYNKRKAISQLSHSAQLKRVESDENVGRQDKFNKFSSGSANDSAMSSALVDGGEDLYDVTLLFTIRGETLPQLREKMSEIKLNLKSENITAEPCDIHIEETSRMSLPTLTIEKTIKERGRRNFLTSSLSSTYMFSAYELFDENGMVLGFDRNNAIVAPNLFNTDRIPNGNTVIIGQSGMGKTYLLMTIVYCLRLLGVAVYVIVPEKGYEWKAMVQAIGGSFIDCAPASKDCINIMEIRPRKKFDEALAEEADNGSLLSDKIHQIITFIQLNMTREEMTDGEESTLSTLMTQLYYTYGITTDNESIWEDKENNILKTMPILEDLYKLCQNNPILSKRITSILDPYIFGDCKNMNGQTNVDLENDCVVISTTRAGNKLPPFSFLAVSTSYYRVKENRNEYCALVMDEVWKMMINEYASEFVKEIYKIIRGYAGIAISATQEMEDLKKSVNGASVIGSSKTKFFFGMEEDQVNFLNSVISLTPEEKKIIMGLRKGNAMFISGNEKITLRIKAPAAWHHLFDTDANSRRKYKEKQMKKKSS